MPWTIHADGSFDLITGAGSLRAAWPAFDHVAIRPVQVDIGDAHVVYLLSEGSLRLDFESDTLRCQVQGLKHWPRWIAPLAAARIEGFTKAFRQGIGFSGPSGVVPLQQNGSWHQPSYLLLGLCDDEEQCTVIAPHAHRDCLFRADLRQTVWTHNFRNREIDEEQLTLELGFRTEALAPANGQLPDLFIKQGDDLFSTLRSCAEDLATANNARSAYMNSPQSEPCYHYCTWYDRGRYLTEAQLEDILQRLQQTDPERHVQSVQIDDGYMPSLGDWLLPGSTFPGGLADIFSNIHDAGYRPGVWVAPFMVGSESQLYQEHPDWVLKHRDGSNVVEWQDYNGARRDREHYVLDTSHPDAMAYVHDVFASMRKNGARFFKTDFMEWGYKDSTQVKRHTPGKTAAQYYDDALHTIRDAIGEDSHWLGCICYFAPHIGYCDSMRVSADVGVKWAAHGGTGNDGTGGGTENMIEESFATLYQNNILWQCDPDVVFVRDQVVYHSLEEARSLMHWHGLLGHSINTSDDIGALAPERLNMWQWMRPQKEAWTARLPYFAEEHPFYVAVRDYPQANGWAVLLLNPGPEHRTGLCHMEQLVGMESADVYEWLPTGSTEWGVRSELVTELEPHHSVLYFISRDGKAPPDNLNLGGSFT